MSTTSISEARSKNRLKTLSVAHTVLMESRPALLGLDWLFFLVANLQTGFGAFIAVYLTSRGWTQANLGFALGAGALAGMLAHVPAGLLVDTLHSKALAGTAALFAIGISAILIACLPTFWPVLLAQVVHGCATSMLNPALAALTLSLVKREAVAKRLGRNAQFAAVGSAAGAVLMGLCGDGMSVRSVFWLVVLLCLPALVVLHQLRDQTKIHAAAKPTKLRAANEPMRSALLDRRLVAYVGCTMLFHLANAAMLPLAVVEITKRTSSAASIITAACILVPQLLVALVAPTVGRAAEQWGRRYVLLIGFCALPVRALLLAVLAGPLWIIPAQALDGLGGAVFGVVTPLVAADISGPNGRYNLRLAILGLAISVAAAVSNIGAGAIASSLGITKAFIALGLAGICAVLAVGFVMPETRPSTPTL